jgi:hypothetical protein
MNPILRTVLAVILGAVVCVALNGLLLNLMMKVILPPAGFRPNDPTTYGLLEARHYLSPFVAHALPSLIGGLLAALIAASHRMTCALVVGGLHLLGGILAAIMIPAPTWFIALDLVVAYLPMAWLGGKLGGRPAAGVS